MLYGFHVCLELLPALQNFLAPESKGYLSKAFHDAGCAAFSV